MVLIYIDTITLHTAVFLQSPFSTIYDPITNKIFAFCNVNTQLIIYELNTLSGTFNFVKTLGCSEKKELHVRNNYVYYIALPNINNANFSLFRESLISTK